MRFLGVFITLFLVGYTYAFSSSCKQIKQLNSRAVSGVYIIRPLAKGSPMVVYCEMAIAGGGFTFLPRSLTIRSDAQTRRQRSFHRKTHSSPQNFSIVGSAKNGTH
ncbi:hypothetical protein OS493_039148 [Desmophyllum pertusum]|uniref:Fibrinogen C-terminal domain-containing protein n=1 Tax=Desmophyllum pertusum TaxID=174260 RepID=A0A9X0CC39_9CNID|nr:hypothetical protein OS493_039148 [Desmophyllum pertusum]